MPDPTDAYCEQCGNRYAFLSDQRGPLSRRRVRIVARGLKDFIQTDWRSLDAAMTLARDKEAHQDFARAADAYQQTFNFCFTCRRSVCADCWNEGQGACRSCAPVSAPVSEPVLEPVLELAPRPAPVSEPAPRLAQEIGVRPAEPLVGPIDSPTGPLVPLLQPDGVQTRTLRPSLVRLIANFGSHRADDRSPDGVLADGRSNPVGWPRPTPWLERPIPVHGRDAGAKATTLPATRNGPESPLDSFAVGGGAEDLRELAGSGGVVGSPGLAGSGALAGPGGFAGSTSRRDPVPVMAEPGSDDGVCHNCGLPTPPRGRFCRRCGLMIARWVEGDSAVEGLAVGSLPVGELAVRQE